ncbi:hypothetical protein LQZ21_12535 [Treponema sp. TIM-1]|uniref:COG3014 family protein n=1 Tax=Treponema sp. TIM-1 TaxID=2898417 RepID=UPI0039801BBE
MKKVLNGLFLISAVFFIASCASNPYTKIDNAVAREDFAAGIETLEADKKDIYKSDLILYYLDKGMLAHYARDFEESSRLLEEGERAIEAAFTKSLTQGIASYLVNDQVRTYDGEDYEDIYSNVFNALNYYHRQDPEGALVEIRRMNNKLQALATKYGTLSSNLRQKVLEEAEVNLSGEDYTGSTEFSNSALARYLGALFYRGQGRADDARIDLEELRLAFAGAPQVYTYPIPSSLGEELRVPPGMARLNVIGFSGLSPVKEQSTLRIPLLNYNYIKIALPVMVYRSSEVGRIEVLFDNQERFTLELLEDMEAVARETFKEHLKVIYLKSIIRATAKGVTAVVFDEIGRNDEGLTGAVFGLLGLGTQIFTEISETADLRLSRYFPAKAYVGGITLRPGLYSFSVNYYNRGGRKIAAFRYDDVPVQANRLNLVEVICLR